MLEQLYEYYVGVYGDVIRWSAYLLLTSLIYRKLRQDSSGELPNLMCQESHFTSFIKERCSRISAVYRTPIWASSGHIQTALATVMGVPSYQFDREYVEMKDGGVVALDWGVCDDVEESNPVFLVLPGLTSDASCVSYLCKRATQLGFRPVVFNKRGHGNSKLTTPRLQSFGDASDVRQAVINIRQKFPTSSMVSVGVSAGSGLLMSYLGEYGSSAELSASVLISPGYQVERLLSGRMHPLYDKLLLRNLKALLKNHTCTLSDVIDVDAALKCNSMIEFEELVYCRINEYSDMTQYWKRNEPLRDVDKVTTPVLCINALDDPVCRKEMITPELFLNFPDNMLVTTNRGGHCGFIEGGTLESWADNLAVEYLYAALEFKDQTNSSQ